MRSKLKTMDKFDLRGKIDSVIADVRSERLNSGANSPYDPYADGWSAACDIIQRKIDEISRENEPKEFFELTISQAIRCETVEEQERILRLLHEDGYRWFDKEEIVKGNQLINYCKLGGGNVICVNTPKMFITWRSLPSVKFYGGIELFDSKRFR